MELLDERRCRDCCDQCGVQRMSIVMTKYDYGRRTRCCCH